MESTRKIVSIGGGHNGKIVGPGSRRPYETQLFDREIVRLANKPNPHFLFLGHAVPLGAQEGYFETMRDIYQDRFYCECKMLKSNQLTNHAMVKELVDWADIIYEGGGNTLDMVRHWKNTGFDKILREAWESGKVLCGLSAGGNCWFDSCSTDSLRIKYGSDQPLISMDCLGFVKGFFVPHCDESDRLESLKELLKGTNKVGIALSNCAAIEIVDNSFRILLEDAKNYDIESYALKTYWKDGEYFEQKIESTNEFRPLSELYEND